VSIGRARETRGGETEGEKRAAKHDAQRRREDVCAGESVERSIRSPFTSRTPDWPRRVIAAPIRIVFDC
jgi:hypothetical protein